jgi:catechol 2,3-dioxygenase-like lactoylglutathione lyase family enzyme
MAFAWEIAHVCYVVNDLESAVERYSALYGTRWTEIVHVDDEWVAPLSAAGVERVRGRGIWAIDTSPPIELFEGPEGSPWYVPPDRERLDHVAYWAEDLDRQSQLLREAGYRLEYTMPSEDGRMRGFGYHVNDGGARIELQTNKAAMEKWIAGEPIVPD